MKRLSIFVIGVALIMALVGCTPPTTTQYTLTISAAEGGEINTPSEEISGYDEGTVVPIVALPHTGYRFVNWTGDVNAVANINGASTTVTMSGDYSIAANFVKQYVLTIDSTDGGEVITPSERTFSYDEGAIVVLVAQADEDYKFLRWTGDEDTVADTSAASTTITMESDCVVTANFIPEYVYLDMIGPGLWRLDFNGQGLDATVTQEGIVTSIGSNPVDASGGIFGSGGGSLYTLVGDFDIRMGYELVTWPQTNGVRVGLMVLEGDRYAPDHSVNVERTSFGYPDLVNFPGAPSEVYLVNIDDEVCGITGTDDLSGTLRVCREGETVTGYYATSDGWHEIYEAEWSTGNVYVAVGTWSHQHVYRGEEVSVLMRTVEIVEP